MADKEAKAKTKVIDTRRGLPRDSIDKIDPTLRYDLKDVFIALQQDPANHSVIVNVPECYLCGRELEVFNKRELVRDMLGMQNIVTYLEFRCKKHWKDFAVALDQMQLSLFNKYPVDNIYYKKMTREMRQKFLMQKKAYEAMQEADQSRT